MTRDSVEDLVLGHVLDGKRRGRGGGGGASLITSLIWISVSTLRLTLRVLVEPPMNSLLIEGSILACSTDATSLGFTCLSEYSLHSW